MKIERHAGAQGARTDLEAYRTALAASDNQLANYDYIAGINRFRHRISGNLLKEQPLINLLGATIPTREPVAKALYSDAYGIRQYAALTFEPGSAENIADQGQLALNTWQPPSVQPIEGDVHPFINLINLIFDGDEVAAKFFMDAIAVLLQHPGEKWAFMMLIIGPQGIGKSILCEMVAELIGRPNTAFPTPDVMKSQFTGWMLNAYLVVFHELERSDRLGATRLKHWITATTLQINAKNIPEFNIANYCNILACANHDDVAFLDSDDRRMFSWISQAEKQSPEYYAELYAWFFEGAGQNHVMHFLLNRDLTGFNPKAAPPMTTARERLIANSRSEAENFLRDALESHTPPFATDLCTATEVLQYLRAYRIRATDAEVRHFLRQVGALSLGQRRVRGSRPNIWAVRNTERWAAASGEEISSAFISPFDQASMIESQADNEEQRGGPA